MHSVPVKNLNLSLYIRILEEGGGIIKLHIVLTSLRRWRWLWPC